MSSNYYESPKRSLERFLLLFLFFLIPSLTVRALGGPHFPCSLLLPSVRKLILESCSLTAILFHIGNEETPPTKLHVVRVTPVVKQNFLH